MHILLIPSWYPNTYNLLYGIYIKEQAEALSKYGVKVGVLSIEEINLLQIWKQKKLDFGYRLDVLNDVATYSTQYPVPPKLHWIRRKIKLYVFKKMFQSYIEENGLPDMIHLHTFIVGELAMWIKETYGVPYVVTEHFTGFSREIISASDMNRARKVFTYSSCNIAVSNEFKNLLEEKTAQDFIYIPNIVNTDFFTLKPLQNREEFYFLNIAFLDKKKNQTMLIKAFHRAFGKQKNIKLIIAGDGPEFKVLEKLIWNLDLGSQVSLYGKASRDEVKKLLHNSDAFVLSSEYETFGVVLIEAMSCGLPVLATKCGGPESIVINNTLGMLSDIKEEALVEKLVLMLKNKEHFDSKLIRDAAEKTFSERVVVSQLKKIYQDILITYQEKIDEK